MAQPSYRAHKSAQQQAETDVSPARLRSDRGLRLMVACLAVGLVALFVTVGFVAIHFIVKFW